MMCKTLWLFMAWVVLGNLFRHTSLKGHFSGFAWAYISQQLQLGPVCREILLQIIPENDQQRRTKIQGLPESQLPGELYEMLKQNKYLIVLDDVWFVRDWLCLEPAFPVNDISHGSKLIITTRNPQILSDLAHNIVSYYEVKLLDRLKSWELLRIKGNFSKDNADPGMVEIGEKMLDHCNGHPLAIAVLGGVLATKKTEQEWRSVLEDLPSHLQRDESYTGVYEVLGMSYYELPYNVKPCFLHFVNFPEDFEIPIERIYNLWIAEGILSSAHDQSTQKRSSMEEIAEVYLQELVQRGMIKLGKKDYQGEFSTCHLHDLMRDKGLEIVEKEGFLKIVDHRLGVANNSTRRVTVYVGDEEISNSLEKALSGKRPPLRSIMLFQGKDGREESSEWIKSVCQDFELLRVLDLEGARLQGSLPCKVENLLFLRHLSLKDTGISELPSSISTLKSLLILDLQVSGVITLPNILWKLSSLIHLYLPSRNVSRKVEREGPYRITDGTPLILDNLKCLEKLVGVNLDKLDQKGLEQLTSLRKFTATCIYNKSILQTMLRSPSIKCMRLKLDAGLLCVDPMLLSACTCLKVLSLDANTNLIPYLPLRPKMFPQCLVNLDISFCKFKTDPMPILETLPNLHGLGLHVCYDGLKLSCSAQGFPRLTYLAFDGLCCVQEWDVQQGGLSKLQNLNLYNFFIPMLPLALPPLLTISCFPCVPGVDRFGPCPHA
ncbi:hypothetical protein RND81_12G227300 [Saponaria officinalis]|uniref:NB-ARC domain-containing protein n=1 Tax=Saponaria officinalis TaxID=3572 RepID=A0AAW1HEB6_SAPOF